MKKRFLFRDIQKKELRNPEFRKAFDEEDLPARLAIRIAKMGNPAIVARLRKRTTTEKNVSAKKAARDLNLKW